MRGRASGAQRLVIWLAAVVQVLQAGPAVLESAEIEVSVEAAGVSVYASYAVLDAPDSLTMNVMRIRGQRIEITSVSHPVSIDSLPGLIRMSMSTAGETHVTVEYRVRGTPSRVPIFVPGPSTDPLSSLVRITVVDAPPDLSTADVFPRFAFADGNTGVAELANVPSLVRLPRVGDGPSVNRAADAGVLVLLALASVWWMLRARLARRAPNAGVAP